MLGLKWTTLAALPSAVFVPIVMASHMLSRWCAIGLIAFLPYVRADADAKSRPFAGGLSGGDWILSGAPRTLWGLFRSRGRTRGTAPRSIGQPSARALALPRRSALATGLYFRRRIGGYTGDCLGAVQQLAELGFLLGGLATVDSAHGLT